MFAGSQSRTPEHAPSPSKEHLTPVARKFVDVKVQLNFTQTSFLVYTTVAYKMLLNLNVFCFLCYPSHYTVNISSPATEEGKEISHSNEVVYCCGIEESLQKR